MNTNSPRSWWNGNSQKVEEAFCKFDVWLNRLARNINRQIFIGIIINVISNYFYPEFKERFPIIYGWYDGLLQFGEFILKTFLSGIYSLFTGNITEFIPAFNETLWELWQQFVNWLSMIQF